MAAIEVHVVRAFVEADGKGGNPAGVVLDMEKRLGHDARLAVAARAGFSETAFVSPSSVCDVRLEFFTPTRQIPHCGHATVGAFGLLAQRGLVRGPESSKETIDGPRRIVLDRDGRAFLEQLAPAYERPQDAGVSTDRIVSALGLRSADLLGGISPEIVRNGNGTLVVGVGDRATLQRIVPDLPAIAEMTERLDLISFYVFARDPVRPGRDATARMFGPAYGIPEEAATGMAAGALGAWLHDRVNVERDVLLIEQGWLMPSPSPSVLEVRLDRDGGGSAGTAAGRIRSILTGGAAAITGTITVDLDQPPATLRTAAA
jgi:PhzF family phenazine biosynthesis protein